MSDIDLHIISRAPQKMESVAWAEVVPGCGFFFQAVRPATGGVRKVTVLFAAGHVDLVVVPLMSARLGSGLLRSRLHRRFRAVQIALDEMATCLQTGYRFLKGERAWGSFYGRVAAEMPGVRLSDRDACLLADAFLTDFLWMLEKLERGELIAAQHALHRQLSETNLRLIREVRLREKLPLPSFGLGRRLESEVCPIDLDLLRISARLDRDDLQQAALSALSGLKALMARLVPGWSIPREMNRVIANATAGGITPAR